MRYEDYDSLIISQDRAISYIADLETYDLLHLNRSGMATFHLNGPEDYLGKKCYEVLQGRSAPCPFCTNDRLKPGETLCWEHYNDIMQRWISAEDRLVEIDGRNYRLETARDVHDQKMKMQRLADKLSVEEVLLDCIRALTFETDYTKAFNCFLERLGRYYRASRAYIFEFDLENQTMSNTHEWHSPNLCSTRDKLQNLPLAQIERWLSRFQKDGEFFISMDEMNSAEPSEYEIFQMADIKSLLAAPLMLDGKIVGYLGVDDPSNALNDLTLLRAAAGFVIEELRKYRLVRDLEYASYTDTLTGVYNRHKYREVLHRFETESPKSLGVMYADVNGMRTLNDSYGNHYGDRILKDVSNILKECGPENVYRIGGDEFVLLFANMDKQEFQDKALQLKQKLESNQSCDVSLGCVWTEGEINVSAQITQADEMMYAEKQTYYQEVLNKDKTARMGIFNEVAKEVEDRQFLVFYQPQLDLKTGKVIGAEALVRKKGSDGQIISPDKFIPYYELEGVIRHVDLFVFREVCAAMQDWQKKYPGLKISVNLSRVTLMEPNIVKHLSDLCKQYHVDPSHITLEVTESISKISHDQLQNLFVEFTNCGFTISLDDFGSKYSNLSILNDLNFNTVKLDKTLVDKLVDNQKSRLIMCDIIQMCRDIRVSHVLAEGIETSDQLALLQGYQCEYGQGYLFAKPLSLDAFQTFLQDNS